MSDEMAKKGNRIKITLEMHGNPMTSGCPPSAMAHCLTGRTVTHG